jgi:hypothetical protein
MLSVMLSTCLSSVLLAQVDYKPYIGVAVGTGSVDATTLNEYYIDGFANVINVEPWFDGNMSSAGHLSVRVGLRPEKGFGFFFHWSEMTARLVGDIPLTYSDIMGEPIFTGESDISVSMNLNSSALGLSYSYPVSQKFTLGLEAQAGPGYSCKGSISVFRRNS